MGTGTAQGVPPRLSIGMPVYNAGVYLGAAIESLLAQTYRDFELIVSDNASTDATLEVCRRYAERDARVRYVRQPQNIGANPNFNRVVELARGELFKWAAHDDLCEPTFIERCVEALDRDASIVAVHSRSGQIHSDGRPLQADPSSGEPYDPAGDARMAVSERAHLRFRDVLLSNGWGVRSYGVVRTDVLRKTGLLEPYYGWEKVTFAELALLGRCVLLDERLFLQRVHPQAASQKAHRLPRLRYLRGYLRAAWRSAPSAGDRVMCVLWIVVYLLQARKLAAMTARALRIGGACGLRAASSPRTVVGGAA